MPTVFGFNGALVGWGVSDDDATSTATGRLAWGPGLPPAAQKGAVRALTKQTVVLAFVPAAVGYPSLADARVRLVVGASAQIDLNSEDQSASFTRLSNGAVLVEIEDSRMAVLSVGRHPIEFWNLEVDQPIATGTLTLVASVMPD